MDVGTLPRRVRRENPDITSPLTKRCSRQILSHFHRFLELRVPRRPRSFAKRVQKWATSKERYHTPLCGYAFSRMKSTPHHPSHALRRHGIAKSLGLLTSKPATVHNRPNSVKIKSRYFAGFCGLKHVPCMSNLLGIFVLGHYGALYTQNDENDVIFF